MSEGPPTEETAVSSFLDYVALACIFASVEAIISGRPWMVVVSALAAAVVFHIVGIRWSQIRSKTGMRFTSWVDRTAAVPYYRRLAVALLLVILVSPLLVYVHALRRDLDFYAMPRHITDKQSDDLRNYLSGRGSHGITVSANPLAVR
jgi:hypothetical protein